VQVAIATADGTYTLPSNVENATLTSTVAYNLTGNSGINTLTGNAANNILDGGGGVDTLVGGVGNDTYLVDMTTAATLQDVVTEASSAGTDSVILRGTSTNLTAVTLTIRTNVENFDISNTGTSLLNITGSAVANNLIGNEAANVITGGAGTDAMDGKKGADIYVIALAADHPEAEFQDTGTDGAIDQVRFTTTAASTLTLYAGDTGIDQVVIGTGVAATAVSTGTKAINVNATAVLNGLNIYGNAGENILTGTGFNDSIWGGVGTDTILGGAGDDSLYGGNGNDLLTGGAGIDGFVFEFAPNATSNKDTITDFTHGQDLIWFSKAIFAALVGNSYTYLSDNQIWSAAGAVAGHDSDDRIIYNQTTGALYYDADGNGTGTAVQIAVIGTSTVHPVSLVYGDFAIY